MMEYKGYIAKVDYDDEAGLFHGEVVNLRDVITFAGESVAELRRALHESVDDYLSFCAARNEPPGKPYSGTSTVSVEAPPPPGGVCSDGRFLCVGPCSSGDG